MSHSRLPTLHQTVKLFSVRGTAACPRDTRFPVRKWGTPGDRSTRRCCTYPIVPETPVFPRVFQALQVTVHRGVAARTTYPSPRGTRFQKRTLDIPDRPISPPYHTPYLWKPSIQWGYRDIISTQTRCPKGRQSRVLVSGNRCVRKTLPTVICV